MTSRITRATRFPVTASNYRHTRFAAYPSWWNKKASGKTCSHPSGLVRLESSDAGVFFVSWSATIGARRLRLCVFDLPLGGLVISSSQLSSPREVNWSKVSITTSLRIQLSSSGSIALASHRSSWSFHTESSQDSLSSTFHGETLLSQVMSPSNS